MSTLLMPSERTWWAFDDSHGPCGCCTFMQGYSGDEGLWQCAKGRHWYIVDDEPTVLSYHEPELCPGDCPQHPLLKGSLLSFVRSMATGILWGDFVTAEEDAALAALSPAERKAKEVATAKAMADSEALIRIATEASKMAEYANQQGIASRCKNAKGKFQEPCIWLYCDESVPKNQWYRNKKGELCAPKRNYLTGSQCWAWEYVDPKSKQRKAPHTCDHLHPGEPGWRKEWGLRAGEGDRTFIPNLPNRWLSLAEGKPIFAEGKSSLSFAEGKSFVTKRI